jgi:beta-lactam-binding protein with PASTA domain/Tol biopolymer transport system component
VRTCRSCGRENADDADFCSCGEYLRWEPTSYVQAVAAPAKPADGEPAAPPGQAPGPSSPSSAESLDPDVTMEATAVSAPNGGAPSAGTPARGAPAPPAGPPPGAAALTLRLPDDDEAPGGIVSVTVEPGQRVTILGLIRNQSEVVDNFDLSVRGVPEDWWTIAPATAYLVPYGTAGIYEQEVQIHIHPPRTPQAQARAWSLEVVAVSRSYGGEVASAPASVTIGPYFDVATELHPERASGRLKARYKLTVHNKANARTTLAIAAEDTDAECEFRFAEPSVSIEPGNAIECPFTVFPPKQIWIGRAVDRRFQITAAPVGSELPQPPRVATFRQRAWLPWWLAIVLPLLIVAAVFVIKSLPKQTVVPNLVGQKNAFAAQQLLNKQGLVLSPKTTAIVDEGKPAGSIAKQIPLPGAKAKKGTIVTVAVYTGTGQFVVPAVVGSTPGVAQQKLLASHLALGPVSPQPLNPNGTISSQLPLAGTKVAGGTAVAVFMAGPAAGKGAAGAGAKAGKAGAAAAAATGAAAAAAGASSAAAKKAVAAQAGTGSIAIPALSGDPVAAAAKLSALGLVPTPVKELANAPRQTVAGTIPAAGSKVAAGATVDLLISSGYPELSYDDGTAVRVINPATLKPVTTVPAGQGAQVEASWSPDGTHIIYSQDGQLLLFRPNVKGAKPLQETQPQAGVADLNPSFAPTTKSPLIAFIQSTGTVQKPQTKLCFATIGPSALNPDCTSAGPWDLGGQVEWSPDGTTILVFGSRNGGANFGILAFTSNVPFSTQASNWGHGALQTNASVAHQGVFAAAFSPNGKQMALVSNAGQPDFFLYIVPRGDFTPTQAQELPVRACQVAWRPDGKQLAVMQPAGLCSPTAFGAIVSVDPANPRSSQTLATIGAHPAYQAVASGG